MYKDPAAVKHVWEDQHPANSEETKVARFHTSGLKLPGYLATSCTKTARWCHSYYGMMSSCPPQSTLLLTFTSSDKKTVEISADLWSPVRCILISVNSDYFQLNRSVESFVCGQLRTPYFESVVQDGLIIRKSYYFQIWKTNIYTAASKLPTLMGSLQSDQMLLLNLAIWFNWQWSIIK